MAKFLNLNDLASQEVREIQIGAEVHRVMEMSVDAFIRTTQVAESLGDEASIAKQMDAAVDMILLAVPTLKKEQIRALSVDQLQALTKFIRGEDPIEPGEGDDSVQAGAEGK